MPAHERAASGRTRSITPGVSMPCSQGRDKVSEQLEQSSRVLRAGLLTCDLLQGDEGQVSSLRVASAAAK